MPELMISKPVGPRSGVTLSEVLVSVVIMSIGVVLLSTLLPISILRTAQATQLTQAVFLRNNVEASIESNLGILSNSQISFPTPTISSTNVGAIIDPFGYFLAGAAASKTSTSFGEFSGSPPTSSILRTSGGILSGGLADQAFTVLNSSVSAYLTQAEQLASLPDSFTLVSQGTVSTSNVNPLALSTSTPSVLFTNTGNSALNVRNSSSLTASYASYRLVMFDITGKFGVVEPLNQVIMSGNNVAGYSWWDPNVTTVSAQPALPLGFAPKTARIEVAERRFTSLMTVRKRVVTAAANGGGNINSWPWAAEIDVVVFYNRSFNPKDEYAYSISQSPANGFDNLPGVGLVDDNNNGLVDLADGTLETGWIGSDDNRTVTVTFAAGSPPPLKKGGYMLEPTQLKWYRIINFTGLYPTSTAATVLLDQDVRYPPGGSVTQGIFMKNIVEVYSLGVRTGQQ